MTDDTEGNFIVIPERPRAKLSVFTIVFTSLLYTCQSNNEESAPGGGAVMA